MGGRNAEYDFQEVRNMKLYLRKGWEGYVFFVVLAAACAGVGFVALDVNIWAAIFSFVVSLLLLLVAFNRARTER